MTTHSYTFREAGKTDLPGVETLFAELGIKPGWAVWKYLNNPDGLARVFIAEDANNTIVGSLAHVPRRFTSSSTGTFSVLQVVDIFVRAELRKTGMFLGLLQYARARVDGPRIGLPNEASGIFGAGLGWRPIGPYERWQFPLSIGKALAGGKVAFLAPFANLASWLYRNYCLLGSRRSDIEIKKVQRFEREYVLNPTVIHGIRSADYLNWRFIENPISNYFAYEFFDRNEPIGYCVFSRRGSLVILSDFVTSRSSRSCVRALIDHLMGTAAARIVQLGTGLGLGELGFIRRRHSDKVCLALESPEGRWLITACDTDSEPNRARIP